MKMVRITVTLLLGLLVIVQVSGSSSSTFVQLSSGKYFFSPTKASWIESWRFCRLLGANLVSIETAEEQQALVEYIKTSEQTTKATTPTVNLALNKAASQSSTYHNDGFGASLSVDGAGFGCNCNRDCSHTELEVSPWWQVDLGNEYKVFVVSLANRQIFPERLHDFEVRIGDNPAPNHGSNTLCGRHTGAGIAAKAIYNVTCDPGPITGRYVTVQIIGGSDNYLTLCEVEVFGEAKVQTKESTESKETISAVSYWASGIKIFQDKKWIWMSTGNDVAYQGWCRNAPDNYLGGEDCLQFNFDEGGCWNDLNCTIDTLGEQEIHFICEMDNTCMIR